MSSEQIPILRELDAGEVAELRARGKFFWADLTVDASRSPSEIAETFGVSVPAAAKLEDFDTGGAPTHKIHVEDELIVFPFWCADESNSAAAGEAQSLNLFRVNVLLHGDFVLTAHARRADLPELVAVGAGIPAGRSERYAVYAVLDGMTSTVIDELASIEGQIGKLETRLMEAGLRPHFSDQMTIRRLRSQLTTMRLAIGPGRGLFERVGEEIEQVRSLEPDRHSYFERVQSQLDRAVDRIDAASEALSSALQVQLNETSYRLTIVATIFLPLTFVTGFFGMNFGWLVTQIDSAAAFWLLGVGSVLLPVLVALALVRGPRAIEHLRDGESTQT